MLLVQAVTNEWKNQFTNQSQSNRTLSVLVSVSFADTGIPLTGLSAKDFAITSEDGCIELSCAEAHERDVYQNGVSLPSGFYQLIIQDNDITKGGGSEYLQPRLYALGIKVLHTVKRSGVSLNHYGQTVVAIQNV